MKIKKIRKIDYCDDVYNLHIEDNHNYIANNHCVSNCHNFENIFSDFISINITEFGIKKLGLKQQNSILKSLKSIRSIEDFVEFSEEILLRELSDRIISIKFEMKKTSLGKTGDNRSLKLDKLFGEKTNTSVKKIKVLGDLENYVTRIKHFISDYCNMPENWIMETSINKNKITELSIQPVWAHPYLEKYIWSKYDHIIMMSGTILDKDMFSYLNGLSTHQTAYYSIDSPFAIKNRPIYYMPIGRMTYTKKVETFEKYVPILEKILRKYRNKKGVIHSHTYELANWTKEKVNNKRLIFHDSESKDRALKIHYESEQPSVLCSPSISTGVDLEYDRARFQILLKVPYPTLASKKNKMRQSSMPDYYAWKTVCGIVQAYGRGIRAYDDSADFIILDGCFSDVMLYSNKFIPEWFMNAVQRVDMEKAMGKNDRKK